MSISILFGGNELQRLTEVPKNSDKDALRGCKVVQGHQICHQSKGHGTSILLVVNSNSALSHTVSELRRLTVKNRVWDTLLSHIAPSLRVRDRFEYVDERYIAKN